MEQHLADWLAEHLLPWAIAQHGALEQAGYAITGLFCLISLYLYAQWLTRKTCR